jgi:hypothetical protein
MGERVFKAVDDLEPRFAVKRWEDEFPTIEFWFFGDSAEEAQRRGTTFWEEQIEPKRAQREQARANREAARDALAKRRAALSRAEGNEGGERG